MRDHRACCPGDHDRLLDTWWLAFSAPGKALGVVIVDAESEAAALRRVARMVMLGRADMGPLYPDDENGETRDIAVMVIQLSDCPEWREEVWYFGKNRLITPGELDAYGVPYSLVDEKGDNIATN